MEGGLANFTLTMVVEGKDASDLRIINDVTRMTIKTTCILCLRYLEVEWHDDWKWELWGASKLLLKSTEMMISCPYVIVDSVLYLEFINKSLVNAVKKFICLNYNILSKFTPFVNLFV